MMVGNLNSGVVEGRLQSLALVGLAGCCLFATLMLPEKLDDIAVEHHLREPLTCVDT